MEGRVPFGTVVQIVAVIAKEFVAFLQSLGRLHAQDPSEPGMSEVRESGVGEERVVDFVSESGAIVAEIPKLQGNVQYLLLFLV